MQTKKECIEIVTKSKLLNDLKMMGISAGKTIMVHVSVSSIGWLIGGPDVLIEALLDSVGVEGTIMAYVGWEERPEHYERWSDERKTAFMNECPPFNTETSRANRKWSIFTEYLRTWKKSYRSGNPGASVVAVGANARFLTENHPLQYGYGPGSPLAKLCDLDGYILQIGTDPGILTILHHAEHLANVPNKKKFRYQAPILDNGIKKWIWIEEYDTSGDVFGWKEEDYFDTIAVEFWQTGKVKSGKIGKAGSFLYNACEIRDYAVRWMESHKE